MKNISPATRSLTDRLEEALIAVITNHAQGLMTIEQAVAAAQRVPKAAA